MFEGQVVSIHIAPAEGAPTMAVDEVQAVEGRGLEGDRYFEKSGKFSKSRRDPKREVTLIELEAIQAANDDFGIELAEGDSRRNIVTSGVPLNHLLGKEFVVGDAVLRGIERCDPCGYLEEMTKPGVRKALANWGGLNAQIVSGGTIRAGDLVRPVVQERVEPQPAV